VNCPPCSRQLDSNLPEYVLARLKSYAVAASAGEVGIWRLRAAGKTHGKDEAALPAVQPATLGALAAGAPAPSTWRAEDNQ
jgi:hypothetical protein